MSIEQIVAKNLDWLMSQQPELNSQLRLAKVSGVGQTTVGRIRRGDVSATIDNIYRLGKAFGVSAFQMLDPRLPQQLGASAQLDVRAQALSLSVDIQAANLSESQLIILANTLAAMRST